MILFSAADNLGALDVKRSDFTTVLSVALGTAPEFVHVNARKSWNEPGGYELLIRYTMRDVAIGGKKEFCMWRIPVTSMGFVTDGILDRWQMYPTDALVEIARAMSMFASAQVFRIRFFPKGKYSVSFMSISPVDKVATVYRNERCMVTERVSMQDASHHQEVLPDWTISGDGIIWVDGDELSTHMRRIRGPGRRPVRPVYARLCLSEVISFAALDPAISSCQRIVRVYRQDEARPEKSQEPGVMPALCSGSVPKKFTLDVDYDDLLIAIDMCKKIMRNDRFRLRIHYADDSGWMWLAPELFSSEVTLGEASCLTVSRFFAAIELHENLHTHRMAELVMELDPSLANPEDVFIDTDTLLL